MTRRTAIKIADARKDQRTTTERPFNPVRTSPPFRTAVPQADRADICFDCNMPGHFTAQSAEPYRPRERRQPPVGVHAIADRVTEDDAIEHSAEAVVDSKNAWAGCPT